MYPEVQKVILIIFFESFPYPNSFIKLDQIDDILHLEDYFQQLLNPTSCGDQNILLIKLIGSSGFELNGIFILALLIWN